LWIRLKVTRFCWLVAPGWVDEFLLHGAPAFQAAGLGAWDTESLGGHDDGHTSVCTRTVRRLPGVRGHSGPGPVVLRRSGSPPDRSDRLGERGFSWKYSASASCTALHSGQVQRTLRGHVVIIFLWLRQPTDRQPEH
jgi:hypothetical protein